MQKMTEKSQFCSPALASCRAKGQFPNRATTVLDAPQEHPQIPAGYGGFGAQGEEAGSHSEPFPPADGGIALLHHPQCPSQSHTGRARTVGWHKPGIRVMLCFRMLSSPTAGDTKAGRPQPAEQGTLGTSKRLMGKAMAAWRGPV